MARRLITILFIAMVFSTTAAQEPTGREIMEKVDNRYTGEDQVVDMTMTLIRSRGHKRVRKVKLWRKDYGKNDKLLMRFLEPADVRGTGFLVWEHREGEDDQWIYLPALKKMRRITAREKSKRFMGTDFSYEDLGSHNLDDYNYTLLRSEEFDGQDCYVVESVPKPGKKKSYSKTVSWVRKDIFLIVRVDFYDKKGRLLKRLQASDIENIDGIWTARRLELENFQKKHKTILELDNIRYNTGLRDDVFSERNLVKGMF